MSETPIDRAERPVEGLGEGNVARVVGGDVRAQFEGSTHQPKLRESGQRDVSQVFDGLLESLVGDGASLPPPPRNQLAVLTAVPPQLTGGRSPMLLTCPVVIQTV
jgi:hypothetical protein